MTALEERQLKGVTAKLIFWIICSTATICSTALYTYFDFRSHFQIYDRDMVRHEQAISNLESSDSSQNRQLLILGFQVDELINTKNQTK